MIRILIADDHTIVRRGLKQIVAEYADIVVDGEATDGHAALEKARTKSYDLVVLDITLPGKGGMDVLKELKAMRPDLPVLILSMHPEDQYAVRALRAGAAGYLTKESAPDELVTAIRKVTRGGKYVSATLAEKLAFALDPGGEGPPHEMLSDREYQVLCMLASGKRVKEIAEELFLSVKTISTYRARVLQKMRMESNAELTRYAIKNRLVD